MPHSFHQRTGNASAGVCAILLLVLAIAGCSTATLNTELGHTPLRSAYDFESRLPDNDDRLFVVLAFSGGGTRAAALSYGVLDALRREQIMIGDQQHRLLDQVDVISAVSGGSYTAAYYGLFGDYPVSRAVMASSIVPPAFAPLRLRNYSGCDAKTKPWINEALQARNLLSREFAVAQGVSRYFEQEEMPYLNLADGGITDNIGVRGSMMSPIAHRGNVEKMTGAFSEQALSQVEQVLVVLVNAQVYPPYPWAIASDEPGTIETMEASFDAAFNTLTTENIAQARREFLAWGANINAQRASEQPEVSVHFATLTFNQVEDATRRTKYNALPTAALDGGQVDALTALGADLLEQSETYQQFLEKVARLTGQD